MNTFFSTVRFDTTSGTDILDITSEVESVLAQSSIKDGLVTVGIAGSTASITTIEFESGVVADLRHAIEKLAPRNGRYEHDARWGDGNGYAHVRAALLGPSITVACRGGSLVLGTWQQIVLCDFDNRPRRRDVYVQVLGST